MKKLLSTFVILFVISILQITAQNRVYTPTQIAPENGEAEQSADAILSWDAVSGVHGPVSYDVQVATDAAFTNIIVDAQTTLGGYQNSDLSYGHTYYWKVRAVDGPDISDWSPIWSFQVQFYAGLSKPNLYAVNQDVKLYLEWDEMTGIYEYQVQYDTSYYWEIEESVETPGLHDMVIINETNAWAVGADGIIMHYNGTEWETDDSTASATLNSIAFVDENNVFAVGDGGLILHNDGSGWTEDASGATTANLLGVDFADATNAWAVGEGGVVIYWDGTTWVEQTSGTSDDLYSVSFTAADNGWAVGKGGTLLFYDTQWSEVTSPISSDLYGISMVDASYGWAVGKSGKMMMYNGTEWTETDQIVTDHLTSIKMKDASNGFATGEDGTYLIFNGDYWVFQSVYFEEEFTAAYIYNDNLGFAVSAEGVILKYDGVGFDTPGNIQTYESSVVDDSLDFLSYGMYYFWRVRGLNNADTSEWSPVYSFNTKGTVILEDPSTGDEEVNPEADFKWKIIKGTEFYTIQFDTDETFPAPTTYQTTELVNTYNFTHFGEKWYWRVQASHMLGSSEWSEVWDFTIINTVDLSSPSNGAVNVQKRPTLTWSEIGGVDEYEILYDTLADFSTATPQYILAPAHEYRVYQSLVENKEYFWKVKAKLGHQETEWSDTWSFTVIGPQSIQELFDNTLSIYPNPSNGFLNLSFKTESNIDANVTVTDLVGQIHQQEIVSFGQGQNTQKLDLQHLANGIYIVRISAGDAVVTRKINLFR